MATPLSAVRINLFLFFLSCVQPFLSCLVRLDLGICALLSSELTSALSCCASCSLSLLQIDSTDVIYSVLGLLEGAIAKFGPLDKRDSCTLVRLVWTDLLPICYCYSCYYHYYYH